ncbi:hypothetical protein [uncultured Sphingomonas sp.]|uniref:hypothetical protein n=1 Tax=uncultured Sphingomonas sp. TaxID=158754 RepID=UPI0035CC62F0
MALPAQQSTETALDRLAPLMDGAGTTHERTKDTLKFRTKDPAAQDKLSVFDSGVVQIERGTTGPVLRYHLISRTLLFCFLAPLLFLSFAGLTIAIGKLQKPPTEAAIKSKKAAEAKRAKERANMPMHPIDKALGAPAPDKPKKDAKGKKGDDDKKPTPIPAYVFAGIFATLYVAGRILEDRMVRRLFQKRLLGM